MNEASSAGNRRNIIALADAGRREAVVGVEHIYLLEEQQSGGSLVCLDVTVPPGHGVPPHTHHIEDETFYVLDGVVEIVGDDLAGPTTLTRGGLFHGPRGRMHGFKNTSRTTTRLLIFVTPGGNLQKMFKELADLTARSKDKPSPQALAELSARYNIIFAPPPG